jgi:XTP/dITP diphosphohydrolase
MTELIFVTNNSHKLKEIRNLADTRIKILSLGDIGYEKDIPETADTLEGNSSLKSWFIFNLYGKNCFADDTGLEVEALNGRPGVYSARFAGIEQDPDKNIEKLLKELEGIPNRKARFRTVISLIIDGREILFEGIVKGKILYEKHGKKGFGYDPVFLPDGFDKSFAEMNLEEKNLISHRAKAVIELINYLNTL